jgi:two-component system, sensor histidine kinase and response regulator
MAKILVIEDETLLRNEVIQWLTLENYEVIAAADGVEGVNLALSHIPDVIVCDIAMPGRDGYDVMLDIRENPQTQLTPFIYITAKTSLNDIRQGMALGADDYITKPFTHTQLLQAIQTRLEKKLLREQHQQIEIEQWKKALEEEHQQSHLKTKMVAMFSHDFRNPLASIKGSLDLLRNYYNRMDEERRLTHLNRAEESVDRLLQMLDDMLIVAQLETGNLDFKSEEINLDQFFQAIVDEFQTIHRNTHLVVMKSNFHGTAILDPRLLRQIAVNLISNAIKYSPPGGEVCVLVQGSHDAIELVVQDQGIGIPEADQSYLFNAFQRASNVGRIPGTGLGLAIVQQAVDLHSGTIQLKSQIGVGTTFTVRIPI